MQLTFKHFIFTGLLILFGLLSIPSLAQKPPQALPEKTRLLFLLDGSGSMLARWEGTLRIAVAKKFLADFVDSLRVNDDLELALRVYGHQFDRRYQKCEDSKLEVPFGQSNHDAIIQKLRLIKPQGTTPIAYSLEQAANDFPEENGYRNIIIIITDGIESCDGDPCAVSLALQKKNIFLKPFVIGIGMDENFEEAFGCMGQYYDASNINAFKSALSRAVNQSLGETTVSVELLDANGANNETNVNVSFINNFTGISAFEFVHYRDDAGRPDSVQVDPVLSYDVVVNTVPPVVKKNIQFEGGRHHVLPIKTPQGSIKINFPGAVSYRKGVSCIVKDPQSGKTLTVFEANENQKLLQGNYDIEVLTLPRKQYAVEIKQHQSRVINLQEPGLVNFISSSQGIGSLYEINKEGQQRWIHNLDENQLRQTINIQPGRYKVVFRSALAKGSKFTKVNTFEVKPGSTLNIRL